MTVAESVLADLREARPRPVCGSHFYRTYRPTFSQRISLDLKPKGFVIASRPCTAHEHKGAIHEYVLLYDPERDSAPAEQLSFA